MLIGIEPLNPNYRCGRSRHSGENSILTGELCSVVTY
jgi:hypothetical protein